MPLLPNFSETAGEVKERKFLSGQCG